MVESNFRYNLQQSHIYSIHVLRMVFSEMGRMVRGAFRSLPVLRRIPHIRWVSARRSCGAPSRLAACARLWKVSIRRRAKTHSGMCLFLCLCLHWQHQRQARASRTRTHTTRSNALSWDVFTSVRVWHIAKTPIFGFPLPPPCFRYNAHSIKNTIMYIVQSRGHSSRIAALLLDVAHSLPAVLCSTILQYNGKLLHGYAVHVFSNYKTMCSVSMPHDS